MGFPPMAPVMQPLFALNFQEFSSIQADDEKKKYLGNLLYDHVEKINSEYVIVLLINCLASPLRLLV